MSTLTIEVLSRNKDAFLQALQKVHELTRPCLVADCPNDTANINVDYCSDCYQKFKTEGTCTRCRTNKAKVKETSALFGLWTNTTQYSWCEDCYKQENRDQNTVAFHKPEETNGLYSNWFPSPMVLGPFKMPHNETLMMLGKAALHEDWETAIKILQETSPKAVKALGREVKDANGNWNDPLWNQWKWDVMVLGLILKFGQNAGQCRELQKTEEKFMVEASKWDKIWGAGMPADDPNVSDPSKLNGENLLGKSLMFVRVLYRFRPEEMQQLVSELNAMFTQ